MGVVLAAVVSMPIFLQRIDSQYAYQGIPMMGPDAEIHYAARVREVWDGFPALGDTFFSAPKNLPYLQPSLPEASIAYSARLFHITPSTAFLWSKAVFAFVLPSLFAWLLTLITGDVIVGLVASMALLMGGALLCAPWDYRLFLLFSGAPLEFLRFSRGINPLWTVPWFLLCAVSFAHWMRRRRTGWIIFASVCFAVLVYSYVYAWSYLAVAISLLTCWLLWQRSWRRMLDLLLFWMLALCALIPYGMHLLTTMQHPWYLESAKRLGMIPSHQPVVGVWIGVFIVIALLSRKRWPATWPLLPCFAVGGLIALNQHVITGSFIVPHHYHWYFIQPLASTFFLALILAIVVSQTPGKRAVHYTVYATLLAAALYVGVVQQARAYDSVRVWWGSRQDAAGVLHAIDERAKPGTVVYAQDVGILDLIPIHTSADVYFATNAMNYLGTLDRAETTYFFDLWVSGTTPDQAAALFPTTKRAELGSRLRSIYYRELTGSYAGIPDDLVAASIAHYRAFYALSLQKKLGLYPLHFIVTTPRDTATDAWGNILLCTEMVYADHGYTLRAFPMSVLDRIAGKKLGALPSGCTL
jgi:hypothetical protein